MPISFVEDSATIGGTEYFLGSDSTSQTPQTDVCDLTVSIYFGNLTVTEQYTVKVYEKSISGGTQKLRIPPFTVMGVQATDLVIPIGWVGNGWEVSVQKNAGTDRSISWSLRKETASLSAAQVNAEVLDVLTTDTFAEPASVPAATASLKDKIGWLMALARNKITQTSALQTLRNDADNASIATAAVSDNGTTATRNEWT